MVELSQSQMTNLAKPIVGMAQVIQDFYKDPRNEKRYREWYLHKYGHEPKDEVQYDLRTKVCN